MALVLEQEQELDIMRLAMVVAAVVPLAQAAPFLQHITDFLSGIRYVPPQGALEEERADTGRPVRFGEGVGEGGWVRRGELEYRAGEEEVAQEGAVAWCRAAGGELAVAGEGAEHVADLRPSHYWVRRPEDAPAPLLFSATPRREDCWLLLAGERRLAARSCAATRQGATGIRALCQRSAGQEEGEEEEGGAGRCTLLHVAINSSVPWLGRVEGVASPASCHQHCLSTSSCTYWSLASSLCLLYSTDGAVERREGAVAGTTLAARGCAAPLKEETQVEYCSCVSASHATSASGYLDPRSLAASPPPAALGRLVGRSACAPGRQLRCTDRQELPAIIDTKGPRQHQLNLTACLVHDVRLKSGGHLRGGGVEVVPDAAACHAACLARSSCSFWTWRGDSSRKCFLRSDQGEVVRRPGAAAGTTLATRGCHHALAEEVREGREEVEQCWCEVEGEVEEEERDLVGSGLIDPRSLGRIVNRGCREGSRRVCRGAGERGEREQGGRGPQLFQGSLGGEGYPGVGPRSLPSDPLLAPEVLEAREVPRRHAEQGDRVAFPGST